VPMQHMVGASDLVLLHCVDPVPGSVLHVPGHPCVCGALVRVLNDCDKVIVLCDRVFIFCDRLVTTA